MAWEKPKELPAERKPTLCIGLPHTGGTHMAWALAFNALKKPEPYLVIEMSGQPVDIARNLICENFLNTGATWLFFLDTDVMLGRLEPNNTVVNDKDALMKMLNYNIPVVTGVYYRRSDPPVPGIYKYFPDMRPAPGHRPITEYPLDQLFEVDAVGAGCLLIRKDVLEKVPRPWFKFGEIQANEFSEDFYFNHKCKNHGIPTMCDPSVQCRHILSLAVDRSGIRTVS